MLTRNLRGRTSREHSRRGEWRDRDSQRRENTSPRSKDRLSGIQTVRVMSVLGGALVQRIATGQRGLLLRRKIRVAHVGRD